MPTGAQTCDSIRARPNVSCSFKYETAIKANKADTVRWKEKLTAEEGSNTYKP